MKKRLFILEAIYSAVGMAYIVLFFFYMYLVSLLAAGEINLFVTAAALGGVIAAGKAMCPLMERLEDTIEKLKEAIKRKKERARAAAHELRIVRAYHTEMERGAADPTGVCRAYHTDV